MERGMKDSGCPWIGMIPDDWNIEKLKYNLKVHEVSKYPNAIVLSLYRDLGVLPKESRTDNHNVTSEDTSKYKHVCVGDFVINKMKAWQGSVAVSDYEGIVSPAYYVYRFIDNECKKKYFHYLLRCVAYIPEYRRLSGGIREGQWDLSRIAFENLPIIVPPLSEQQQIATFLDETTTKIDSAIAEAKDLIESYKGYKKSVITEAVTKGLDKDVELKGSGFPYWPSIPNGWIIRDVKYLFEIVKRIAGKEGYDIISVTQKGLKKKDISSNEGQIAENYSNYQFVNPTDFVMNHMDLLTGWVDCSDMFGVTSPDYRVFRLREKEENDLSYYKYVLQSCYLNKIFYSLGQGVSNLGRWRLQTFAFNNFKFPVPPLSEQRQIAEYLDEKCALIDRMIEEKEVLITQLQDYRKSVVYEYVTGKKRIPL